MHFFDTHAHIGLITEDPIEQLIITQEAKQDNVENIISILILRMVGLLDPGREEPFKVLTC